MKTLLKKLTVKIGKLFGYDIKYMRKFGKDRPDSLIIEISK